MKKPRACNGEIEEERKRKQQRGHREDREERGQIVADLTFIMCHYATLVQHLHSHTR